MDRRFLVASVAAGLIAVVGGSASAGLYPFSSKIDFTSTGNPYWNGDTDNSVDGKWIKKGSGAGSGSSKNNPFEYLHDIQSLVPLDDLILDALLTLEFVDNDADDSKKPEYVQIALEGGTAIPLGEINTGPCAPPFTIDRLADRILNVRLEVTNEKGDLYLKSSLLSGTAEASSATMPVPASALLGFLGLTTAGLKLRKWA